MLGVATDKPHRAEPGRQVYNRENRGGKPRFSVVQCPAQLENPSNARQDTNDEPDRAHGECRSPRLILVIVELETFVHTSESDSQTSCRYRGDDN